jgi:hypothetical protein
VRRGRRRLLTLAPILVLAAENLVVFGRHYFGGYGFPWDFVGSYYASAAYWTEAVSRGSLPMWMPFQSMGYPLLLNLQTAVFYPPMWLFPLLGIPYTLPAAVTLQCLHILAGALGMYALVRALLRSRREALLAAFCFQLFGGFYSNAEHVDIVRAFAFTPWLFWACLPPPASEKRRFPRRILLAPLVVFALAVGGYPGNLLAALFLLAVFVVFVLAARRLARPALLWAAAVGGSAVLGIGMAAIHLAPAWIYREEILRHHNAPRLFRASLGVPHLPGLVLENRGMPIDVSMTSTWVGFAVLAGICFLARASWKRLWPYAALALLAAAMTAGNTLPLHPLVRRLLPPLGYSRFPSSDYRGFLAMLLILLAAAGWRDLRHRRLTAAGFLGRWLPVALFAAWGLARIYASDLFWPDRALAVTALLATLAASVLWRSKRLAIGLSAMLAAVSFDAARVLPRIQGWAVPDLIGMCRAFSPTPARMHDAGVVVDPRLFDTHAGPRPARTEGDGPYRASGYLAGDFVLADFGASAGLRARDAIAKDEGYLAWMRREWTPVVIEPAPAGDGGAVEIADLRARAAATSDTRVVQESYGIDHARYRVDSDRPLLLVENEVYFPGWYSDAAGPAIRVNGHFRGWILPAGNYELETRFRLGGLGALAAVTAAAWLSWLAAVLALRKRSLVFRA